MTKILSGRSKTWTTLCSSCTERNAQELDLAHSRLSNGRSSLLAFIFKKQRRYELMLFSLHLVETNLATMNSGAQYVVVLSGTREGTVSNHRKWAAAPRKAPTNPVRPPFGA